MSNCIREIREALRKKHGPRWDRTALARRIGVSERTLMRWEAGEAEPAASDAIALARELGVTVEQLGFRKAAG